MWPEATPRVVESLSHRAVADPGKVCELLDAPAGEVPKLEHAPIEIRHRPESDAHEIGHQTLLHEDRRVVRR